MWKIAIIYTADRNCGVMNFPKTFLCFSMISLATGVGFGGQPHGGAVHSLKYEGGTLALKQDNGVKAIFGNNELILLQGAQQVSVPAEKITGIASSSVTHRRFGAAVLGVVPVVRLGSTEKHYV